MPVCLKSVAFIETSNISFNTCAVMSMPLRLRVRSPQSSIRLLTNVDKQISVAPSVPSPQVHRSTLAFVLKMHHIRWQTASFIGLSKFLHSVRSCDDFGIPLREFSRSAPGLQRVTRLRPNRGREKHLKSSLAFGTSPQFSTKSVSLQPTSSLPPANSAECPSTRARSHPPPARHPNLTAVATSALASTC